MNPFWLAVVVYCCSLALPAGSFAQQDSYAIADQPLEKGLAKDRWITYPKGSTITVIGIAGRRKKVDEAVALALEDAARKISLYHGVYGESVTVLNQAQNILDYFADTDYRLLLKNEPSAYAGSLIFDRAHDVLEKEGSVYVRVRYEGVHDIPAPETAVIDGVPQWVTNQIAVIPGFLTGIGGSKNRGTPQKTHQASYEQAIVALLPSLSTQIDTAVVDITGGPKITSNTTVSKGALSNVMILETFFDRSTGYLWTLIAAKEYNPD
jgi:hypothetical protein